MRLRTTTVWLDNSKRPGKPIRRRLRIYVGHRRVLSLPLSTVGWSR
jgi:hypothetical protein